MTPTALPTAKDLTPDWRSLPWLGFLVIAGVFFFTSHDLFYARYSLERSVEEFNPTVTEALNLLAQFERGQLLNAVAYLILGGWGALTVALALRERRLQMQGVLSFLALAFVLWVPLSLLWADVFSVTVNKVAIFVMLSVAVLGVAVRFKPQDLLLFVVLSSTAYLLAGLVMELAQGSFRPWIGGYRFSGTIHPNGQGLNCGLLVLAALLSAQRWRGLRLTFASIALVAFVFLLLTKSRTPLGAMLIALAMYWVFTQPFTVKVMLATLAGMAATFVAIFRDSLIPALLEAIQLGRTDLQQTGVSGKTLTGRTALWEEAWYFITERPLLGWGYNAFWTVDNNLDIGDQIDWLPGSAHSIYFDLMLGLGIIGAVIFLAAVVLGIARSYGYYRRSGNDPAYVFFWSVMLFALVHGAAESTFLFPAAHSFLLLAVLGHLAFAPPPDATTRQMPAAALPSHVAARA